MPRNKKDSFTYSPMPLPHRAPPILLSPCPGLRQVGGNPANLYEDLVRLRRAGAGMVISCVLDQELPSGPQGFRDACTKVGLQWLQLPIKDMSPPDPAVEPLIQLVFNRIESCLDQDLSVAIHCKAGLGRTGTIAARYLINLGLTAEDAIRHVRIHHNPGAIETLPQERYLKSLPIVYYPSP